MTAPARPLLCALEPPCAEHSTLLQICRLRDYLDAELAGSGQDFKAQGRGLRHH